jgi:hypothetical protein
MLPLLNVEMNTGVKSSPVQGGELKMSDPSPEWQIHLFVAFGGVLRGFFQLRGWS